MSAGCSMLAMTRSRPPQSRQVSMSMANTRLRRCAQVRLRWRSAAEAGSCGLAGLAAPGCVLGTIRARSALAGANTPWYRVRWAAFEPALLLYRRRGFADGEAFADYRRSSFNQFLHLEL